MHTVRCGGQVPIGSGRLEHASLAVNALDVGEFGEGTTCLTASVLEPVDLLQDSALVLQHAEVVLEALRSVLLQNDLLQKVGPVRVEGHINEHLEHFGKFFVHFVAHVFDVLLQSHLVFALLPLRSLHRSVHLLKAGPHLH